MIRFFTIDNNGIERPVIFQIKMKHYHAAENKLEIVNNETDNSPIDNSIILINVPVEVSLDYMNNMDFMYSSVQAIIQKDFVLANNLQLDRIRVEFSEYFL